MCVNECNGVCGFDKLRPFDSPLEPLAACPYLTFQQAPVPDIASIMTVLSLLHRRDITSSLPIVVELVDAVLLRSLREEASEHSGLPASDQPSSAYIANWARQLAVSHDPACLYPTLPPPLGVGVPAEHCPWASALASAPIAYLAGGEDPTHPSVVANLAAAAAAAAAAAPPPDAVVDGSAAKEKLLRAAVAAAAAALASARPKCDTSGPMGEGRGRREAKGATTIGRGAAPAVKIEPQPALEAGAGQENHDPHISSTVKNTGLAAPAIARKGPGALWGGGHVGYVCVGGGGIGMTQAERNVLRALAGEATDAATNDAKGGGKGKKLPAQ